MAKNKIKFDIKAYAIAKSFVLRPFSMRESIRLDIERIMRNALAIAKTPYGRKKNANTVNEARRYRGYPDMPQNVQMSKTIGCCRLVYNNMKSDKDEALDKTGKLVKILPTKYKNMEEYSWLNEVDALALSNVQLHSEKAYSDWLSGKSGKPCFKKKHVASDSYTTNVVGNNIKVTKDGLVLPKVPGVIKLDIHRPLPENGKLKSVTVTREPDGKWYFSLLFELPEKEETFSERIQKFIETGDMDVLNHIGLDMSLPYMYVDSNGNHPSYELKDNIIEFQKQYRGLQDQIAREQRRLSKMQKHSKNYEAQCIKIAKLHAKAKHRRNDFLHQMSSRLSKAYDVITIEDLNMAAIKQSLNFGKSVSDNGWGAFVTMLEYKCRREGKLLLRVDKWFPSSKTCSVCGHVHHDLQLGDRTYECPVCGNVMDRDEQAAINIDNEGLRILKEVFKVA